MSQSTQRKSHNNSILKCNCGDNSCISFLAAEKAHGRTVRLYMEREGSSSILIYVNVIDLLKLAIAQLFAKPI